MKVNMPIRIYTDSDRHTYFYLKNSLISYAMASDNLL